MKPPPAPRLVGHDGRTLVFEHDGQRYVVKRLADKPRRLMQTLFMRWLVKRVTGSPLPMRTLALSEAASSMAYEANRLKSLAAAACGCHKSFWRHRNSSS